MELLKDKAAFDQWKRDHIHADDVADDPREFPCYVYTVVKSWPYEEIQALYIYRAHIEQMLSAISN